MRTVTPGRIEVAFTEKRARFPLNMQFSIPAKGVAGIFGAPGCGKTTVARCIAGLERLSTGFCAIDGEVWQDETTFRAPHLRPIGYVLKEPCLFPHLWVRRNLLYAVPKRKPRPIALDEVAELLAITSLLDRSPAHLSAGERQRVAIGRALLSQPRVLLMDEPLATLDRRAKREILSFLKRLNKEFAVPIIYISHDMADVEYFADHLVMMERGAITATGGRCIPCRVIRRCLLRRVTKPPSALMPWSAAMTGATSYSSSSRRCTPFGAGSAARTRRAPAAPHRSQRRQRLARSAVLKHHPQCLSGAD